MTHQAPNPGDSTWDPADPHGFHKDAEGHDAHHQHHVSKWQTQVLVLAALLFFTFFTVAVSAGEVWISNNLGIPITQLWNVIIAMSIATVKAMLVCMYFMHLRHDNPLNTYILLFTLLTLGLFLAFPSIDTATRGAVNPIKAEVPEDTYGGTGQGLTRPDGSAISGPIIYQVRREYIDDKAQSYADAAGREEPADEDLAKAREDVWFKYYDYKAEKAHGKPVKRAKDDEQDWHAMWLALGGLDREGTHADPQHAAEARTGQRRSTPERAIRREGRTPGLFESPPTQNEPVSPEAAPPPAPDRD